jgi:hypothetical protein
MVMTSRFYFAHPAELRSNTVSVSAGASALQQELFGIDLGEDAD